MCVRRLGNQKDSFFNNYTESLKGWKYCIIKYSTAKMTREVQWYGKNTLEKKKQKREGNLHWTKFRNLTSNMYFKCKFYFLILLWFGGEKYCFPLLAWCFSLSRKTFREHTEIDQHKIAEIHWSRRNCQKWNPLCNPCKSLGTACKISDGLVLSQERNVCATHCTFANLSPWSLQLT